MPVNGVALGGLAIGSIFLYSAIKGKSVLASAQAIITGQSPTTVKPSEPITETSPNPNQTSTGGPIPTNIGGGTITQKEAENAWIGAGGPGGNTAKIAGAIAAAESGLQVTVVQQGQPYSTTGWGLWQITPGNSVPSVGVDKALLTANTNARAAVFKYKGAGNSFSPWTTFTSGAYQKYMATA